MCFALLCTCAMSKKLFLTNELVVTSLNRETFPTDMLGSTYAHTHAHTRTRVHTIINQCIKLHEANGPMPTPPPVGGNCDD